MTQKMESVTKNDALHQPLRREPNVIGNAEEQKQPKTTSADFGSLLAAEEAKRVGNKTMTLDNFARKVSSKHNLLFALGVKGTFPPFSLCYMLLCRSNLPPRASLLHHGLPSSAPKRQEELLHQRPGQESQRPKIQRADNCESRRVLHQQTCDCSIFAAHSFGRRTDS